MVIETRDDVVLRLRGTLVDPLGVEVAGWKPVVVVVGLSGLGVHPLLDVLEHALLVLFGDPEEHAEDPHRNELGELGDEVEGVAAHQFVESSRTGRSTRPRC